MRTIRFLVRKEFLQVFRDRATVFQVFFIPVVQLLVLSQAATFDIRRTRLAVVDADVTTTSARLVMRLEGGTRFRVVRLRADDAGVEDALMDRAATAVLRIPRGFERDLARGAAPVLLLEVNAEEGATAAIVQGAAQAVVADVAREFPVTGHRPRAGPLEVRAQAWFNPTRNYKHFMVPAILVSLVSIIGLLLSAQNIAREKELGTLEQLNVTPITTGQFIAGKLLPFWILALATFLLGLGIGRLAFGIPMRGPVALVIGAAMVYLVVVLGLGLWISTFTRTQQQTMFVAFFVLLVFLLMSGLFTPVESMPRWAQLVAEANPVRHFVWIMRAVLVRGAGAAVIAPRVAGLAAGGALVLALAVRQHARQVR